MPVADVAAKLGVTEYAVRNALHTHGLKKKARFWGADEEKFILKNWREMDPEEIAKAIKQKFGTSRTKWAVINKYRELAGLRN